VSNNATVGIIGRSVSTRSGPSSRDEHAVHDLFRTRLSTARFDITCSV